MVGEQLNQEQQTLVPFLKWAGGKRWLAQGYNELFPAEFGRYLEPFLGSGAVFFHLQPTKALLSDKNAQLINLYAQIRDNWKSVQRALHKHQRAHSKSYYYRERARERRSAHGQAAQLLYLNRTCWNGLYRVNLEGRFNVPIGTKSAVLLDTDDFARASMLLQSATLKVSDFELVIDTAEESDFLFVDPPYVTRHNFNGFVKYNEILFTWEDQIRLARAIRRAGQRGVQVLLTNAHHPSIRKLYRGISGLHRFHTLKRASVLAASAQQRGEVSEMALTLNYEP